MEITINFCKIFDEKRSDKISFVEVATNPSEFVMDLAVRQKKFKYTLQRYDILSINCNLHCDEKYLLKLIRKVSVLNLCP